MQLLLDWLHGPWPWYVAGPLIGAMVPLLLWLGSRSFGISQNLEHLCAITQPQRVGVDFFLYDWKNHSWSLAFAGGAVLGGFGGGVLLANPEPVALSAATRELLARWGVGHSAGLAPVELYGLGWRNLLLLVGSGILVGFGTRYASGCTSGHAITGLSTLQPQSLLAVLGIFAGGLAAAHLLLPLLF
ncbi:MAG TPA: YeeE/YedE thiosulfate transporter family protein [Gammaproteobacteria bacterium]